MSWLEKLLVNNPFFDFWRRQTAKKLLGCVRETSGQVLELGCGKGTTTMEIAKRLPNAKIIATDFDEEQVALAKKQVKRVKVMQADASNLIFKSNTFSAVFAFLTFHHVDDWKKALREAFRVLKSGGDLYIDDLALKPFPRLKHFWDYPVPGIFSKVEFLAQLRQIGFKIIKAEGGYKFLVHAKK